MPDDVNGLPLAVGDRVIMQLEVVAITDDDDDADRAVTLRPLDAGREGLAYLPLVRCNPKLVVKYT